MIKEHIDSLVEGCFLTCFAYGQTGSGKTFTMDSIITHTVRDLFAMLFRTGRAENVVVGVSYYEVYMSKVCDPSMLRLAGLIYTPVTV